MKPFAALFLLAALSLGIVIDNTFTRPLEITVSGRATFTGEVIAVRESTVVLGTRPGRSLAEIVSDPSSRLIVPQSRVLLIATPRETHPITGMLIGAPAGCLAGLAIGSAVEVDRKPDDTFGCNARAEREANQSTGMLIGTGIGMAAGCAIGQSIGEQGTVLISVGQRDFTFLKGYARYPDDEPEALWKIQR